MPLPKSVDDLSVQLIYSEGAEKGGETLWMFYSIALAPFTMGIPANQVALILQPGFVGMDPSSFDAVDESIKVPAMQEWLPVGYLDYFKQVYQRATSIDTENLSTCNIRIITGRGFYNFKSGGHIVCGEKVDFCDLLPPADVLTILDICNSPRAVGCFSRIIPSGDDIDDKTRKKKIVKFKKRPMFANDVPPPVVCDQNDSTWAFRVGFDGQDPVVKDEKLFVRMSPPLGDSVTASLLSAIESLVKKANEDYSLDELFKEKYEELHMTFLPNEAPPKPYSSGLEMLMQLIKNGVVPMNMDAYDSGLLAQQGNWFLTFERAYELMPDDAELADVIVAYIEQAVQTWHTKNSKNCDYEESDDSACAWSGLVKMLGPFRHLLANKQYDVDSKTGDITATEDGIPFQALAVSCPELPGFVVKARQLVATGGNRSESE